MAGKKDIVEQALKLIAGGAKEAGPSVAERAAKNLDVFNTANRLGVDTNDIAKLQETKRLMDYHKGFMGDVRERAKSANEIVQQMRASGAFPMEIGTRYTTEHSRRTGQGPWTVTNYYVDPKNPQGSYGYYVRRELPDGGYEESVSKIRDPKLEAMHGPEKWEELQRGFVPMTGPKVVKAYGGSIREGYGPGGWVDDIVKMAGKVFSPEEKAENLSRFVSGSKLFDEAGNPQRLYHITNKDFDVFKPGGEDPTISGPAIWLSPHPEKQPAMHNVGSRSGFREGTNVMPVYARMMNPLVLDTPEMQDWARTVFANKSSEFPYLISPEAKKAMQDEGYDGIILGGGSDGEVIAFEGGQIKSAVGNTGAYDPADPRIDRNAGGRAGSFGNNSISGALNVARGLNGGE